MISKFQKIIYLFILWLVNFNSQAQIRNSFDNYGMLVSPRVGYDTKTFYNNLTPYIDYKGGIEAGLSLDYYWNWFGIGADFDFIKNKPKNILRTDNLYLPSGDKGKFSLFEQKINRTFVGIGPSFRYQISDFLAELNLRVGAGSIKGGELLLKQFDDDALLVNYHAGYKYFGLAGKTQLRLTYFITNRIGLQFGSYYLYHYKPKELSANGIYSVSWEIIRDINNNDRLNRRVDRKSNSNGNISSIGVFVGLVYKFKIDGGGNAGSGGGVSTKTLYSTYTIVVHARDKLTKKPLRDATVNLVDKNGKIIKTGVANKYGVVVFRGVKPADYNINGTYFDMNIEAVSVVKNEFNNTKTLRKTLLYNNQNILLKSKLIECNRKISVTNSEVFLKDKENGKLKKVKTDAEGRFIFHIKPNHAYEIYGKKADYISKIKQIKPKDYKRNKTLYVKLEVCVEKAGCGTLITLKNIHYDLDKYFIREDAKPELNRLVQFMKDNPKVHVEISSHTDSRASKKYNQILSQNRAKAAVDYIVSQGISRDRLTAVGYGESKLLNRCADGVKCSEQEHQVNRRTEMKVICP